MQRFLLYRLATAVLTSLLLTFLTGTALGQSSSGSVGGTVTDPTGAVITGATVELTNPVSGYSHSVKTDSTGQFRFYNVPFNPYRVTVTSGGFAPHTGIVQVSSSVPVTIQLPWRSPLPRTR